MEDKQGSTAKISLIVGLVIGLIPWGLGLIGVSVNIWLGGAVLALSFGMIVYAFWIWEKTAPFHIFLRIATIVVAGLIYFGLVGRQMLREYGIEHAPTATAPREQSMEISISCNYEYLPIEIKPNELSYVVSLNRQALAQRHDLLLREMYNQQENKFLFWPPADWVDSVVDKSGKNGTEAIKCDLLNHATNIAAIKLPLSTRYGHLTHWELKPHENSMTFGPIDSGKTLSFYVVNDCPIQAQMMVPKTAKAKFISDDRWREITLESYHPAFGGEGAQLWDAPVIWSQSTCDDSGVKPEDEMPITTPDKH